MKIPTITNISKLEDYLDHNSSDTKVMLYILLIVTAESNIATVKNT